MRGLSRRRNSIKRKKNGWISFDRWNKWGYPEGSILAKISICFLKVYRYHFCDRAGLIAVGMNTDELHKHEEAIRTALLQSNAVTDMAESNSLLHPPCLVFSACLAGEIRVPDHSPLVDICGSRQRSIGYNVIDSKFSEYKGSDCKSCKEFEK